MAYTTLLTDYLARGLDASKPTAPPNIASGAAALYLATDTLILYSWDGTAWQIISSPAGPGVPVRTSTSVLTAAQVAALHVTPVTLLAAPGAGSVLMPLAVYARYAYGGTPFAGSGDQTGVYFSNSVLSGDNIARFGSLTASASRVYAWPVNYPELAGSWDDISIVAANPGTALTGGSGTLTITTLYTVIPA